jgi:pyruvate formate lyase activating enzyme
LLEWRGRVASAVFLPGCNFRCPYCHNHGLVLKPDEYEALPLEAVLGRLEELRKWNDGVVVSGGEPTLHPGLPKLVAKLRAEGWPVKLDTNGTKPEVLAGLLELHMLDAVSMDIKAPINPVAYRRNSGVAADLEAVTTSVELLAASGIDVEFRTTVTPGLLDDREVREIRELVRSHGESLRYKVQAYNPTDPLDPALCTTAPGNPVERQGPARPKHLLANSA